MKSFEAFGKILAIVFHPLFMVMYFTIYLSLAAGFSPLGDVLTILFCVFFFTVLLPGATTYFLREDIQMSDRKKRSLPIGFTIVSYIACYFVLSYFKTNFTNIFIIGVLVIFIIGLSLIWIINKWYKISMHGTGIGAIFPVILYFLYFACISHSWRTIIANFIILFFGILVLFQRVLSRAHSKNEVLSGFALGAGISFSLFYFLEKSIQIN